MRKKRLRDLSIVQNNPNSEEGNSEQQTIIGSSNVLETLDEPAEFQIESGGTRRGRGRTLLKDLYDLNPVKLFGHYSTKGQMLPINYESWRNMPDSNKNQALDNIKERFALEVSDDYIKKALGKKWRDHKSTLKKE
ncbi:rexB [Gossypium arboreum]|uniref:RexB n=1 Tax=Gossypium arboreum TaxID=29729 RepID=A0A0B0NK00_GOSAR|nr:rexB [Gossypium arboreum]